MTIPEIEKDFEVLTENIKNLFRDRNHEQFLLESDLFIISNPNNKAIYVYRGIILEEKGLYEEAIENFDVVLSVCPDFYHLYRYKAHCYLSLKSYILARDSYKEFLKYKQDDTEAWCMMCLCFYLDGKKDVALGLLDHALGQVSDPSLVSLLKGMLFENEDMEDDALINYVQSQILSNNDESRNISSKYIYRVIKN